MKQVDWHPFTLPPAAHLIDGVDNIKASKVFLLYPYRWWLAATPEALRLTHSKSDLPNRQTYDFGESINGRAILLISYADGDINVGFWNQLQKTGRCTSRFCDANMVTDEIVKHAHIFLSQIYNISISRIPRPIDGMMQTWDQYPINSAWGLWKPGYNFIESFRDVMNPNPEEDVYVLNGDYSTGKYSGWAEGSLHAGDILLKRYFGIPQYIPTDIS